MCMVVLNLYPYNPAHMMIAPSRHITKFIELTKEEIIHLFRIVQGLQNLLDYLYNPKGYNLGMNQGREAGASIEHLHFHLVPRYVNELGYIDIIGNTRVVVESLEAVKKKVEENINTFLNEDFFNEFLNFEQI